MASSRTWVWTCKVTSAPGSPVETSRGTGTRHPVPDPLHVDEQLALAPSGRSAVRAATRSRSPPAAAGRGDGLPQGLRRQVADGQGQGVGDVGGARAARPDPAGRRPCSAPAPWWHRRSRPRPASPRSRCTGPPRSPPRPPPPGRRPPAWPVAMAVRTLVWKKTRSTTTASGRISATRVRSSVNKTWQPLRQRWPRRRS